MNVEVRSPLLTYLTMMVWRYIGAENMKAFEVMGKVDEKGQLSLDEQLEINTPSRVKVIVLLPDESEPDPDDTPIEEIKASLRRALQQAKEGRRIPLEQMWEGIDAE